MRCIISGRRAAAEIALFVGLAVSMGAVRFGTVCGQVRADTLRLHIVANSDSAEDQALKLTVRDAVLAETEALFADVPDKQTALHMAAENLKVFERAAADAVRRAGKTQSIGVKMVRMRFSPTDYDDFSLPPGEYDAIRIELGEAKGHNWFCVLYPGLCLPSAQKAEYPEKEENAVVTGNYAIGFALLDWLENLR